MFYLIIRSQIYLQSLLGRRELDFICDKMGMYDVYAPTWGGVLKNMICIWSGIPVY